MTEALFNAGIPIFGSMNIFIFLLSIAKGACIGIYFAYFAPKGSNEEADFLVGGRKMGVFPIVMSLSAR